MSHSWLASQKPLVRGTSGNLCLDSWLCDPNLDKQVKMYRWSIFGSSDAKMHVTICTDVQSLINKSFGRLVAPMMVRSRTDAPTV